VVYYGSRPELIKLSREHNDANVLSLGARFLTEAEAFAAAREWLAAPFPGEERHRRRIAKLDSLT
jgi:ribose 5-phosphate isomerase B